MRLMIGVTDVRRKRVVVLASVPRSRLPTSSYIKLVKLTNFTRNGFAL